MHTNLENQTEQNMDILPLTKLKKPRSEKQIETDKKFGQRLRDKKLLKATTKTTYTTRSGRATRR